MNIYQIGSENDLRSWLRENSKVMSGVTLQWVEPSPLIGSAIGAADVIFKYETLKVDLELKFLMRRRRGIRFSLRPSQRRFHHSSMRKGGKTALLYCEFGFINALWLVRGDRIPLRDYADDPSSGCIGGVVEQDELLGDNDIQKAKQLKYFLTNGLFWL